MEKRSLQKDLGQDAPQAPNVNFLAVLIRAEQNFRGTVPARGYLLSQAVLAAVTYERPHESKIADPGLTALVDQNVGRLEIAVDELG